MINITRRVESLHLPGEMLDFSTKSILKYLGIRNAAHDDALLALVEECLIEFKSYTNFSACYLLQPCTETADGIDFGLFFAPGNELKKNLLGCDEAIIFVATIGMESERQRRRMEVISMSRAVILDAIGSAAVECFCDWLCEKWQEEFADFSLRRRFSPGYGDLPLTVQKDLLDALDASKRIGVTLTDSLLMLPQKSVSAFVGLGKTPEYETTKMETAFCRQCDKQDCQFRLS